MRIRLITTSFEIPGAIDAPPLAGGSPVRVAPSSAASPARHVASGLLASASALLVTVALSGCFPWKAHSSQAPSAGRPLSAHEIRANVRLERLFIAERAWHLDAGRTRTRLVPASFRGLRLLSDAPRPAKPAVALVRSIVRSNLRIDAFDALILASVAVKEANEHHLDSGFFGATILQESGFAPDVVSPAGAVGIGQFTSDTADDEGVDPFDWQDALRGSAALIGRYVNAYDGVYDDPYAASLEAYNAGPGTVSYYKGDVPYAETREYVTDIYDRWARISRDETRIPWRRPARLHR